MKTSTLDLAADWLIELWWERVPLLAGRISRALSMALAEGLYLAAWPRVAAFAPLIPLVLGLLAGWHRFGAEQVFTQSMLILSLAVVFGFLSSQMGALFVLGYAVADFFLYDHPALRGAGLVGELQIRVALLITYMVLAMIAVAIPFSIRLLRAATPMPPPDLPDLRLVVESAFSGIICAFLLFLYLQAVPLLVRPLFTWRGWTPPVDAIYLVQNRGWLLALTAFAVAVLHVVLEYGAAAHDPEAVEELADTLEARERLGILDRLPKVPRLALASGAGTLFFAGLLDSWSSALILFLGLISIEVGRSQLVARARAWSRTMEGIPVVIRLLAAFAVAYFFSTRLLANVSWGTSFQPLVWALLISLPFVAIAFPGRAEGLEEEQREGQ